MINGIKLSKRLQAIANMVSKGSIIADIGCDHAFLDIYLIQNKVIKKSYACDVTEGALNQAKKNISISNVNNIELRLGDGLSVISKEDNVDTIVMAGLGSSKIVEILTSGISILNGISNLIIQSNNKVPDIRRKITKLGYFIEDEKLVEERNKIYTVIKFTKGKRKYNSKEFLFGPILLSNKDKIFNKWLNSEIIKYKSILKKLPKKNILKRLKVLILIIEINKQRKCH